MFVKMDKEEFKEQQSLIALGRATLLDLRNAKLFYELLDQRHRLIEREQDAWLLRFALVHGISPSKIKDFQFTRDGEVVVGDAHEPAAPSPPAKVGGR